MKPPSTRQEFVGSQKAALCGYFSHVQKYSRGFLKMFPKLGSHGCSAWGFGKHGSYRYSSLNLMTFPQNILTFSMVVQRSETPRPPFCSFIPAVI